LTFPGSIMGDGGWIGTGAGEVPDRFGRRHRVPPRRQPHWFMAIRGLCSGPSAPVTRPAP